MEINYRSREWLAIKDKLNKDLERDKEKLCNPSCTHDEANIIRGRILYIKEFLLQERAAAQEAFAPQGTR